MREKVGVLEERKNSLQEQLKQATEEKNSLAAMAERTAKRLNLAERLVNGLKDENERWGANVDGLEEEKALLVGNVMVSASFIAYTGPFNGEFRRRLVNDAWVRASETRRDAPRRPTQRRDTPRPHAAHARRAHARRCPTC